MIKIAWPSPSKEDYELASKYGYTPQLIARWRIILGDEVKDLVEAMENYHRTFIRVNTLKISARDLRRRLENEGFLLEETFLEYVFEVLESPYTLASSKEYLLGYFYIQDLSSVIPPLLLNPRPGETVLDLAAAPGGKTTHMAQISKCKVKIVAVDISRERMASMRSNVNRLGFSNIVMIRADGRKIPTYGIRFDKVLLDAPCTGEGVIPRDPSRKNIRLREYESRVKLQRELIKAAYDSLKQGGILVYSTCTYSIEENEENVRYAVEELGMEIVTDWPIEGFKPSEGYNMHGTWRAYTHRQGTLGAFYAVLKKTDS